MIHPVENGYVYYRRLLDNKNGSKWKQEGTEALATFNGFYKNRIKPDEYGTKLREIALAEQSKEINFLNSIFETGIKKYPLSLNDYNDFIITLNSFINIKEGFKEFLEESYNNEKGRPRAITESSFIDVALERALKRFLNEANSNQIINYITNDISIDNVAESITDKIVEYMLEELSNMRVQNRLAQDQEAIYRWKRLDNLFKNNKILFNKIKDELNERLELQKIIQTVLETGSTKINTGLTNNKNKLISKSIVNFIAGDKRASVAGFIREYISVYYNTLSESNNKNIKVVGTSLNSNIPTTDTVTIFSINQSIDKTALEEKIIGLNNTLNAASKKENRIKLEKYYNNFLKNITDSFIVYENVKNVKTSGNFGGFRNGDDRPFSDLPLVFGSIDSNYVEKANQFYWEIINTLNGAILYEEKEKYENSIKDGIIFALSKLFFDDWNEIGRGDNKAIHLFDLNGLKVPLSYLLLALSEILTQLKEGDSRETLKYARVEIKTSGQDSLLIFDKNMTSSNERWEAQRKEAESKKRFQVFFLENFLSLLQDLLKTIN